MLRGCTGDVTRAVSGARRQRSGRQALLPADLLGALYRSTSRCGSDARGRLGCEPSSQIVEFITDGDVASVGTSPYRRRTIDPGDLAIPSGMRNQGSRK